MYIYIIICTIRCPIWSFLDTNPLIFETLVLVSQRSILMPKHVSNAHSRPCHVVTCKQQAKLIQFDVKSMPGHPNRPVRELQNQWICVHFWASNGTNDYIYNHLSRKNTKILAFCTHWKISFLFLTFMFLRKKSELFFIISEITSGSKNIRCS